MRVQNFLLERGDTTNEKGGGEVDVEMRRLPVFYYFTVQSHLLCVGKSKVSFITFSIFSLESAIQDSHPSLYCTKTWYHLYISDPFW